MLLGGVGKSTSTSPLLAAQVANKVSELLMLHEGREVCCQSEQDLDRYERLEREGFEA